MSKHTRRRERQQARNLKHGIGLPEIDWDSLVRHQDDYNVNTHPAYDIEDIHDDGTNWPDEDDYRE